MTKIMKNYILRGEKKQNLKMENSNNNKVLCTAEKM